MPEHVMLTIAVAVALAIVIPSAVAILRDLNPNPYTGVELPELVDRDERDIQALADAVFAHDCDRAAKLLIPQQQFEGRHRAGSRQATIGAEWIGAPRKAAHR